MELKPLSWDKHQLYKSFWKDLPSLFEIMVDLERNYMESEDVKQLHNLGFVTYKGHRIPRVKEVLDAIQAMRPKDKCTAHIYISMFSFSETFGKHNDSSDVFYIQGTGKTDWIVEDEGTNYHYVLEEGDMIFVPRGYYHTPSPLSTRYGISIGFDTHLQRV